MDAEKDITFVKKDGTTIRISIKSTAVSLYAEDVPPGTVREKDGPDYISKLTIFLI